jgi:hypothetical protein
MYIYLSCQIELLHSEQNMSFWKQAMILSLVDLVLPLRSCGNVFALRRLNILIYVPIEPRQVVTSNATVYSAHSESSNRSELSL